MPTLRVCHAIGTSDIGGTERFLLDLLRRHHALGIESAVCVMDAPGALASAFASSATDVEHLHASTSFVGAARKWRDFVRRTNPSVIVLYGARANLLGRMVPVGRPIPLIAALRSTVIDDRGSRITPVLDRLTFGRVTACVSNSRAALDALLDRGYPAERLGHIPPGIDLARFTGLDRDSARATYGVDPSELVLVSVANLKSVKNQSLLIEVSATLAGRGVAHRLWLVGDGPERPRLEAQVRGTHPTPASVVFAGREADPLSRYAAADLFVLSSDWEGSPTAVLEALAAGLPVVTTDVGDVKDFVTDAVGRTVPPRNAPAFTAAVESVVESDRRRSMSRAARLAAATFSSESAAARYAELFTWAVRDRGPLPCLYAPPAPRRVLRVLSRLNVGGPTLHVVLLSRMMERHGVTTTLVSGTVGPDEGDMSYVAAEHGVAVHTIPSLGRSVSPLKDVAALIALTRLTLRFRPDVVHTHASKGGAIGRLAAILFNLVPFGKRAVIVHTYHGHTFEGYFGPLAGRVFRSVERALGRLTDRVVVLSAQQFDDIVARFRIVPGVRARIVPLGLDLRGYFEADDRIRDRARRSLGLLPEERTIVTAGRLTSIKNHAFLLRAFRGVAARLPHARLLLAGDGDLRGELQRLAVTLGIESRVQFLGWRKDLPDLFAAADVVALSSNNEGTPVAIIEAIAAGCPVVATDVGGVSDVVGAASGILVPVGDESAFADALITAAGRGRLPAVVRADMRRFAAERLVDDLLSLYREVLHPAFVPDPEAR